MIYMLAMNATDVRKNWSRVSDSVIREKPQFIKRTHDFMCLSNVEFLETLLTAYNYTADSLKESDGSITLSLNELDIIENAENEEKAKEELSKSILEYAAEFYEDFNYWSTAPNRKKHIPYIFKALVLGEPEKIKEYISCRPGKN